MIARRFPLIRPGVFGSCYISLPKEGIIVRPNYLSICAADMRYFLGLRPVEVLKKKLPMVLIHEAVGTVIKDPSHKFAVGEKVVLLPCGPKADVDSNYQTGAFFRSSNADGFCQELISLSETELVKIPDPQNFKYYVLAELLSVCFQGLRSISVSHNSKIGLWGDGSLSYLMGLLLKTTYPDAHICVIGKHENKLQYFTFCDSTETIFERHSSDFDVCIECVGGNGAENAIEDILISSKPKSTILLTGVSETPPKIRTRLILEKGLKLVGTTRSVYQDFQKAVDFINKLKSFSVLDVLFSKELVVSDENALFNAFEGDSSVMFKTILKFEV